MISSRWRFAALFPALIPISGCGLDLPFLPMAGEPPPAELPEWQYGDLLNKTLMAMPEDMAEILPEQYVAEAARFLTRTLETAPDGASREWHSANGEAALAVRLISTAADGTGVCREAVLNLETADANEALNIRTCRLNNGLWTR